jgi:hypothetical protein
MREVRKSVIDVRNPSFGIRKAPVPFDTDTERNEHWKNKIISFEKREIEPALIPIIQQSEGSTRIYIQIDDRKSQSNARFNESTKMHGAIFTIGTEAMEEMGGNVSFILKTIGEIYEEEGYRVYSMKDKFPTILINKDDAKVEDKSKSWIYSR